MWQIFKDFSGFSFWTEKTEKYSLINYTIHKPKLKSTIIDLVPKDKS